MNVVRSPLPEAYKLIETFLCTPTTHEQSLTIEGIDCIEDEDEEDEDEEDEEEEANQEEEIVEEFDSLRKRSAVTTKARTNQGKKPKNKSSR